MIHNHTNTHFHPDGSIDYGFYRARADRLRRSAMRCILVRCMRLWRFRQDDGVARLTTFHA